MQLFIWPSAVVPRLLALALIPGYFEPAELPVPSATSIALVSDPGNPTSETVINDAKKAETPLGIQIYILEAHTLRKSKQRLREPRSSKQARSSLALVPFSLATRNKLLHSQLAIAHRLAPNFATSPGLAV